MPCPQHEILQAAADAGLNDEVEDEGLFRQLGAHLSPLHVFALANVLRRPIVLFSAPAEWGMSNAGVYLPGRVGPTRGLDGDLLPPIFIAWSSAQLGHFVSLIPRYDIREVNRALEAPRLQIDPNALPRDNGELLVFGPYDEAACGAYLQGGQWMSKGTAMPGGDRALGTELQRLKALWQTQNPSKSFEDELLLGQFRKLQEIEIQAQLLTLTLTLTLTLIGFRLSSTRK